MRIRHIVAIGIVFIIVLIIYMHVREYLKVTDEPEIFVLDSPLAYHLEDLFKLKQPLIFSKMRSDNLLNMSVKTNRIKVDLTQDKFETIDNSFLLNRMGMPDIHLWDHMSTLPIRKHYDIWIGNNINSVARVHVGNHWFLIPRNQSIRVRMMPPMYFSHIKIKKYGSSFFESAKNLWSMNNDKRLMDIEVNSGEYFYIPSFWWVSIQYKDVNVDEGQKLTEILSLRYDTVTGIFGEAMYKCTKRLYFEMDKYIQNKYKKIK